MAAQGLLSFSSGFFSPLFPFYKYGQLCVEEETLEEMFCDKEFGIYLELDGHMVICESKLWVLGTDGDIVQVHCVFDSEPESPSMIDMASESRMLWLAGLLLISARTSSTIFLLVMVMVLYTLGWTRILVECWPTALSFGTGGVGCPGLLVLAMIADTIGSVDPFRPAWEPSRWPELQINSRPEISSWSSSVQFLFY